MICIILICILKISFSLDISYFYLVDDNGKELLAYLRGRLGMDCNCAPFPSSLDLKEKIQDLRNNFLLHSETKMMLVYQLPRMIWLGICQCILKFGSWIVQRVSGCMQMYVCDKWLWPPSLAGS
jgi:hypothetical protein